MLYDIFICYEETTGLGIAAHEKTALAKWDMQAFVARDDLIVSNGPWKDQIDNCISNCKFFVPILTCNAFVSEQVKREISLAYNTEREIIFCIPKDVLHHEIFLQSPPFDIFMQNQVILFNNKYELADELIRVLTKKEYFLNKCKEFYKSNKYIFSFMQEIGNRTYSDKNYKVQHGFLSTVSALKSLKEFVSSAKNMETFKEVVASYKNLISEEDIDHKNSEDVRHKIERDNF